MKHRIETVRFELGIPCKSHNNEIQNRIIRLFNSQFSSMLNEVFEKYGASKDYVVETLQLELEPVLLDQLEKDLVALAREQLITYFAAHNEDLLKLNVKGGDRPLESDRISPILHYLMNGRYPWYYTNGDSFSSSWRTAVQEEDLLRKLRSVSLTDNALKRLTYQLNILELEACLIELCPDQASCLMGYRDSFLEHLISGRHMAPHQRKTLEREFWFLLFRQLLQGGKDRFKLLDFIEEHLQHCARNTEIIYYDLLLSFQTYLEKSRRDPQIKTELLPILNSISDIPFNETPPEKKLTPGPDIIKIESLLLSTNKTATESGILKTWFSEKNNKRYIREYWINPLREKVLKKVLELLIPTNAVFVETYHQNLWQQYALNPIGSSFESYRRSIWSFTLDYLIESFSSVFQAVEFINTHIKKLANRYQLDQQEVVRQIIKSILSMPHPGSALEELESILTRMIEGEYTNTKKEDKYLFNEYRGTHEKDDLIRILSQKSPWNFNQSVFVRTWFLKRVTEQTLRSMLLDPKNRVSLTRCIDTLAPDHKYFIRQYLVGIESLMSVPTKESSFLKKARLASYELLFDYLKLNYRDFDKIGFIKWHLKALLAHLGMSNESLLAELTENITSSRHIDTEMLEPYSLIHGLNNQRGVQISSKTKVRGPGLTDLHLLWKYFSTGKLEMALDAHQVKNKSGKDIKVLEHLLLNVMENNPKRWFLFLQKQKEMLVIHKEIRRKMDAYILRSFHLFQQHYLIWTKIQRHLQKKTSRSPVNDEVDLIFYLQQGLHPLWIKDRPVITGKVPKSMDDLTPVLLHHQWSEKSLYYWTHHIDRRPKEDFLRSSLRQRTDHFVMQFYIELFEIYVEIPQTVRPSSLRSFEMTYWGHFFKAYRQGNSVLTKKFSGMFLKLWSEVNKYSLESNTVVNRLRHNSSYAPDQSLHNKLLAVKQQSSSHNRLNLARDATSDSIRRQAQHHKNSQNQMLKEGSISKWNLENAGLIIVHPFISHLFKILDYLDTNGQFSMKALQMRAVYLLHYVATGLNGAEYESELTICKLLCNMTIEEAIPPDIILTSDEMNKADEMLEVVISRWEKLGRCSPEALRNTFLKRKGLLEKKDDTFQLTLETSGTDILLDYIPWNMSMSKLPWTEKILLISWR